MPSCTITQDDIRRGSDHVFARLIHAGFRFTNKNAETQNFMVPMHLPAGAEDSPRIHCRPDNSASPGAMIFTQE